MFRLISMIITVIFIFDIAAAGGSSQIDSSNYYTNLKDALKNKDNTLGLKLTGKNLTKFPDEIFELKNLRSLYLDSNSITEIPHDIAKLKNLRVLNVCSNKISELPEETGELKELVLLSACGNVLTTLPKSMAGLQNLSLLGLEQNQFSSIPDVIFRLKDLRQLWLSGNKIETIPDEIKSLKNLNLLFLDYNRLEKINPVIFSLDSLTALSFDGNQIESIPPGISALKKLDYLSLVNNLILKVPPQIGDLKNLRELYLALNKITMLPPEIGKLDSLKTLDISGNPLTVLPFQVAYIKNLEKLYLYKFHFDEIPDFFENIEMNGTDIIGYKVDVDYDKIKKIVTDTNSAFYINRLIKILQSNGRFISSKEFFYMYYGYPFYKDYNPTEVYSRLDSLFNESINKANDSLVIRYGKEILEKDPVNIGAMMRLYLIYRYQKDMKNAIEYRYKYQNLISAIIKSGDGEAPQSAYYVINKRDEYDLLLNMKLLYVSDEIKVYDGIHYDVVEIEDNPMGIEKVFFNIEKPYKYFDNPDEPAPGNDN